MFYNDVNSFNWQADNFGATFTDTGFGTPALSGAAHTKGGAVTLLAGTTITEDCYGLQIVFTGTSLGGAIRQHLADIVIDEAGGTNWLTKIANLMVCSPHLGMGGIVYYFPLFIKAGSSIGFLHQCATTSIVMQCGIRVFGKPSHPELIKVGQRVETLGANTATSAGTAITSATGAVGAYSAALGTTAHDNWWWQVGLSMNDTTMNTVGSYSLDVAAGDATNKRLCMQNESFINNTNEQCGKPAFSIPPLQAIPTGQSVYVRAASSTIPDSAITTCVYALS